MTIPTYNGEAYLAEAVKSVLGQTFQDFELVIVDDRSTDSTVGIIRSFADSRIRFTRNDERLGLPGNWNRCLSLAQGEFICIFHQDDVMQPDNLERKIQLLSSDPSVGFVHSAAEMIVEPSAPSVPVEWIEKSYEDFVAEGEVYFFKLLFHGNIICAPTVLARRQPLVDLGGFDDELEFTSDYEMWMKVCASSRVAFLSQPLVRYRWHAKNASHEYRFERGVQQSDLAARRALKFYLEQKGQQKEEAALEEALRGITKLKRWNGSLEQTTEEQKAWISELELGKAWIEEQRIKLQESVESQKSLIQEQKAWIGELERGKNWLDDQRMTWQKLAEETLARTESKLVTLEKKFTTAVIAVFIAILLLNPIILLILVRLFGTGK
ncbi:MAG: glycosyltransferase [Acidobacteriia bacterium]|nr:glycosyltransferase [Terriglobia bacterium]